MGTDYDGKNAAILFGFLVLVGGVIIFAREVLAPFFGFTSIISFVALVVFLFAEDLRENAHIPGIALLVSLVLLGISLFIGYGIGNSAIGQAAVQTNEAVTSAEQQVFDTLDQSIQSFIIEGCKTLDESSCATLKATAVSAKTLVAVQQKLNDLQNIARTAKKIENKLNN